jgi:hypothetical protein
LESESESDSAPRSSRKAKVKEIEDTVRWIDS